MVTFSKNKLDAQLVDSDGFLKRSLTQEERGRKSKRRWTIATCCVLSSLVGILVLCILVNPKLLAGDKASQGWQLWNQRRLPEAEAKFREALMESDKDNEAWTGLGWTLTNGGRLKDASEAFKKALALEPDNLSAQNGIGQCALGLGDLALAEESLKKSSNSMIKALGGEDKVTADSLPAAWYGLVNVYLLKDDFEQAKQWADRIAKVKPDDDTLKGMLAQIEKRDSSATKKMLGRDEASKATDASKKAEAWQLWSSGQPNKAIDLFRELTKSNPKDANLLNGLGWSLLNSGEAKEAHETFIALIKLEPKHVAGLNGAGQSALALHDWTKAEEYLKKGSDAFLEQIPEAKLIAPNLPAAWFGLARVHLVQGNYDQAIEWAEKILKYDSGNAEVKQMLEWAKKKDNSEIKKMMDVK